MILFYAICLLILITICIKKNKEGIKQNKNAIVCLTRGYESIDKYNDLIIRNNSIYEKMKTEDYDIIIFHEGNITQPQQIYIQDNTLMKLIFKSIKFYNNIETNEICMPTELSNSFGLGYKNMCYFWSIDFLEYLKDYEYIIRIDEDCIITKINETILDNYKYNNIKFSSPLFQGPDVTDVTNGMKEIFKDYINSNELKCPYTNVMIINIPYFQNNADVQNILSKIKDSNCIFSNRWGDLPIWGYILSYMLDKNYYTEDKSISYIHGSHNIIIN